MRPRIRTLKPEIWSDERIGVMSRAARLLLIGMITMADDEGRLRAMPSAILGHVFPYDQVAPRRLAVWCDEVAASGIVRFYEHAGIPYAAFTNWGRHQRVNRPTDSVIPAPVGDASSVNDHGTGRDDAVSELHSPRAPADRSGSRINEQDRTSVCVPEPSGTSDIPTISKGKAA